MPTDIVEQRNSTPEVVLEQTTTSSSGINKKQFYLWLTLGHLVALFPCQLLARPSVERGSWPGYVSRPLASASSPVLQAETNPWIWSLPPLCLCVCVSQRCCVEQSNRRRIDQMISLLGEFDSNFKTINTHLQHSLFTPLLLLAIISTHCITHYSWFVFAVINFFFAPALCVCSLILIKRRLCFAVLRAFQAQRSKTTPKRRRERLVFH